MLFLISRPFGTCLEGALFPALASRRAGLLSVAPAALFDASFISREFPDAAWWCEALSGFLSRRHSALRKSSSLGMTKQGAREARINSCP